MVGVQLQLTSSGLCVFERGGLHRGLPIALDDDMDTPPMINTRHTPFIAPKLAKRQIRSDQKGILCCPEISPGGKFLTPPYPPDPGSLRIRDASKTRHTVFLLCQPSC